jgi:hypothetical protein
MISLAVYDPRPLEPDWVRFGEHDPAEDPGELNWLIKEHRWNRDLKAYETFEDSGHDIEELFKLLDHIYVNGIEVEVEVDATEMGPPERMPSMEESLHYKCKAEDWTGLHTMVTFSDCEEGTLSTDTALYFIEGAIYNREKIHVNIGEYDPTP